MSSSVTPSEPPFQVVIAGGGVAALESALALRALAADHVEVTLIAPNADFVYRPMSVLEPFAYGPARRHDLAEIARDIGVELVVDRFAWLDEPERTVHTEGAERLGYDALILAIGARPRARYEHAVTIDDRRLDDLLHGLIQDVEGGYVHHLAFVVPARIGWPLPIYELALMTAERAYAMNVELAVTIVTPEEAPVGIFGEGASRAVAALLAGRNITIITGATCEVPDGRHVVVDPGDRRIEVDRVVALPELDGPAVRGLKAAEHGFIPIDAQCRVSGLERVYAAGDATDFAIKQGGIGAQQADTAAGSIAAACGLPVEPTPFAPVLRGMLLTGGAPRYLSARVVGGRAVESEVTDVPTWSPPTKIASRYLAPYLEERDRVSAGSAR
jgi:sulfide:quinone oxidoreductase